MLQEKYIHQIGALVGVAAIIALCTYAYSTVEQTNYSVHQPVVITVAGKGEVYAKPDTAEFTFSVDAKEANVSVAQSKSADAVNAIITFLKSKGVDEKDIQTRDYSISPNYEYSQTVCTQGGYCPPVGNPKLIGYEVMQTIGVKVHKTDTAGGLISGVGGLGATNVSGLTFTIGDQEAINAQAREKAITDAQARAEKLARNLGVRLVRLAGFSENGSRPIPYGVGFNMKSIGLQADEAAPIAPQIPTGQNLVTSEVSLSYEIR